MRTVTRCPTCGVVIRKSTADTIRANRERFGDKKTLRDLWGVSRIQLDLLCEAGLMASIEMTDLPALVDANHDLEAARKLVDRIAADAKSVHGKTGKRRLESTGFSA
ncbi:hypothetical protein ACFSUD_15545 [Sulfitobacter aestuarii]|uniref:XRE family transcriptional regulator n=1 Tax=Sulfitobacter aestuarii TaxID=2161676 RepID=A0ABW5U8B8_9RHOB